MARRNVGGGPGSSGNGGSGNGGSGNGGGGNGGGGNGGGGNGGGGGGGGGGNGGGGGGNGGGGGGPGPQQTPEPGPESTSRGADRYNSDLTPGPGAETQTTESATYNTTDSALSGPTTNVPSPGELNKRSIDAQLSQAIQQSMTAYPEKWAEVTGTTNPQFQFESVTGISLGNIFNTGPNGSLGSNTDTNGHILYDPIPGEPGPGLGPGAVTLDGAEVPGVDYFATALDFFNSLFGGPSKETDLDTVSDADLAIEPQIPAGNLVGPGPDVPNGPDLNGAEVIFDPDRCVRIANQLIADPNVESRFKNLAKWHLGSNVPCDTFFNDVSYAANLNEISGVTQRQIQLEALGLASEDITASLAEEANVREAQRKEDIDYITEVNTRLSDDVVNLGEAALNLQTQIADLGNAIKEGEGGACAWYDIQCHLGNFTGQVGTVAIVGALGLGAYFLLKRRR